LSFVSAEEPRDSALIGRGRCKDQRRIIDAPALRITNLLCFCHMFIMSRLRCSNLESGLSAAKFHNFEISAMALSPLSASVKRVKAGIKRR
jgi:hypothetical protein